MDFLISVLQIGLIYGIVAMGVYISYKILDFPDLTVDGSYTLGAAVTAVIASQGGNPYLSLTVALVAGSIAGMITGILHVYGKVTNLLSGIIVMTGLYSVNLAVMNRPNISIMRDLTIFKDTALSRFINDLSIPYELLIIILSVILLKLALDWFFGSRIGIMVRAVGSNPQLVTSMSGNVGMYKITGLAISNGLVAFAGAMMAQLQRYSDIGMSSGMIVLGLVSVILGISITKRMKFLQGSDSVIIGAILYQAVITIALKLGLPTILLKLLTAVLLSVILIVGNYNLKFRRKKA